MRTDSTVGNVSLGSGTYAPLLTGATGAIPFFDFNEPLTYTPDQFSDRARRTAPLNFPNGTLWSEGEIEQSGDGQLRWNSGATQWTEACAFQAAEPRRS